MHQHTSQDTVQHNIIYDCCIAADKVKKKKKKEKKVQYEITKLQITKLQNKQKHIQYEIPMDCIESEATLYEC